MCGICGIVNGDPAAPVDGPLLETMTRTLTHRGPDEEGYFRQDNAGLGHRRLSIIDLAGGQQPIFNEDGSAVIVFNGEVYNYRDLAADLAARGHRFRTRSDTEAILHSYEEFGDACVDRLRGMFAFAVWDRRRRRLLLARDRLGVKPLYFYRSNRCFAFASEIKALLELPFVPRELDREALDLYLSLRYVPGPRTMFQGISKLQPGHRLALDEHGMRIEKYWDIPSEPASPRPFPGVLEEFQQLLEESVRLRLVAEVPLGVFLSGGLDSSSILAVMSRLTGNERIKTFSVGYEGTEGTEGTAKAARTEEAESNEFPYARLAAGAFGADHHEFRVSATQFSDFLPDLVWHLDEPLADPSCIPLYFISRLARKYITVVLSGEGADEVLGGYGIYKKMLLLDRIYRSSKPLARSLFPQLANLARGELNRHYLRLAGQPLELRYRGVSRGLLPELKAQLLVGNGAARSEERVRQVFARCFRGANGRPALDRMLYADTKVWLPDDILLKADKMTMANALELRVPFLDHKLVEFAAQLPPDLKLRGSSGKYLLRRAMQGVLPEAILRRSKKGFPVPTETWLRRPMKDFTRDLLLAPQSACRTYFQPQVLERIVVEHELGRVNRQQELWTLMVFECWHRLFLERRLQPSRTQPAALEVA